MDIYEPVLIYSIVLSDLVIREQGTNKISLIGCFNQFNANKFPFNTPPFFITASITNLTGKIEGVINVTAIVENPHSGHVLSSTPGRLQFSKESPSIPNNMIFEIPFPVVSFTVSKAGVYSVKILFNNQELGQRALTVNQLKARPKSPKEG